MDPRDAEDFKQSVYAALGEVAEQFKTFREQLESEVREYKRTVNSAISLLSSELIEFQTTERKERKERQKRSDIKDGVVVVASGCLLLVGLVLIGLLTWIAFATYLQRTAP